MNTHLSMAAFALAASISPGPVNVLVLASAAQGGFWWGMRVATGATVGFSALLLAVGCGLRAVMERVPGLNLGFQIAGVAFLLYMAYGLWRSTGRLSSEGVAPASMWKGASMQWINPKAWLCAVAGVSTFAADGRMGSLLFFCAVYFGVCLVSMGVWAAAGAWAKRLLLDPVRSRIMTRCLAVLLVGSIAFIV
ncbi:LysE family translocator [Hydrogenophaga sp.]|uniref:LysE family translocator n=1 Tax=Hydrogenophaga sp. TaxID=1904254 RepID=UPI002715A5FC|nr:LysE family translocator [Hydrogenophaga sp.]MDO9437055.1 LysE family translocator [Hydrogenophaga sp.]